MTTDEPTTYAATEYHRACMAHHADLVAELDELTAAYHAARIDLERRMKETYLAACRAIRDTIARERTEKARGDTDDWPDAFSTF